MQPTSIALIVFGGLFFSALLGMFLRTVVPEHHLNPDSKDAVKLAMGLVATMAALVLGLLTASAKGSFDVVSNELQQSAADILLLDRALAQYGPETKDIRDMLRRGLTFRVALSWPEDVPDIKVPEKAPTVDIIHDGVGHLTPQNDAQRGLQTQALQMSGNLLRTRWLVFAQTGTPIPTVFLVVLVSWLALLFVSFGFLTPRNTTVVAALAICALAVSGSIFLILEMSRPLEGLIKVSSAPLRYALSHLGQ